MNCHPVREMFSAYLDGAVSGREMQAVSAHLESCGDCRAEFEAWRGVQQMLAQVGPMKAPDDLGLRLRLAISRENARRQGHWWDVIVARWENTLRPALLQAAAGFAGSVALVGSMAMLIGVVAAPQAVMANDEPLGALTSPHYLYSGGQFYKYRILSGPTDPTTDAQVRDQLMLQVYEPARAFGEPVRGQVLITFSGTSVHS